MNIPVPSPVATSAVAANVQSEGEAGAPCVNATSVVMESSADQSWTDFCRGLRRPALLLGDVDEETSEQP